MQEKISTTKLFDFEEFYDSSPDLFCIAGYDGYFKKINPSVSKLLEFTEEELFSKKINDFVYEPDKFQTADVRKKLTEKIGLFNFENRYVTKSGKIVWLLWTSHPIPEKKIIYAVAKNITVKKNIELERNTFVKDLTLAIEDLKKTNYTMAHDLQSPINNLISVFDLIDTETIENKETKELLDIIELSIKKLKNTLTDVLSEVNNPEKKIEKTDFTPILKEVLLSIQSLVQNSHAVINYNFENAPTVNFNKVALKSIFINLITNAIKFNKRNTIPKIRIYSKESPEGTQLIIEDEGEGFDMNVVKDKVFKLHQKFNEHESSNGIGLYLVHKYVTDFDANITLESKPNEGATFCITFKKENPS